MKIYEDLLNLIEEFINELDDETVDSDAEKRRKAAEEATSNFYKKVIKDGGVESQEERDNARKEMENADLKFKKCTELRNKRDKRLEKKLAAFKERLLNKKPQSAKETQKAGSEHDNAIINQHFRDELEKSLAVSNECFEEIMAMIEGFING